MYNIVMVIGHRRVGGEPVPLHKILAMKHLCQTTIGNLFSGGFSVSGDGWYVSVDDCFLTEPCSILESFASDLSEDAWAQLKELASRVAFELGQECVLLARYRLDGEMYWATPSQVPLKRYKGTKVYRAVGSEDRHAS